MSNESYRSNQIPQEIQAEIDTANARADAAEARNRFTRSETESYVALALLIGLFAGGIGHSAFMSAEEERLVSSDRQENSLAVTTPVVETAPARECFDGDTRACPSANALSQGLGYASCLNGHWDPCAPLPPPLAPVAIRLPRSSAGGFTRLAAYDCETNREVDIVGNQRRGPVYYVAHSNDGTQILRACPQASTQRLQEQVRTLDERLRRIEVAGY